MHGSRSWGAVDKAGWPALERLSGCLAVRPGLGIGSHWVFTLQVEAGLLDEADEMPAIEVRPAAGCQGDWARLGSALASRAHGLV